MLRLLAPGISIALLATGSIALGQQVTLTGVLGNKALLVVDGTPPKAVAAGESWMNVKVLSASGDQAVLEIKGQRVTQRVGDAPVSVGGKPSASNGSRIVLQADGGGHFLAQGSINGRAVQFMVDTGATGVGMGVADAERIGIKYREGQPIRLGTANGVVQGWRVKLNSIRIGDVEVFEVDAAIVQESMPYILLGNSYLTRFQMRRDNDQLTLERRY